MQPSAKSCCSLRETVYYGALYLGWGCGVGNLIWQSVELSQQKERVAAALNACCVELLQQATPAYATPVCQEAVANIWGASGLNISSIPDLCGSGLDVLQTKANEAFTYHSFYAGVFALLGIGVTIRKIYVSYKQDA